jgi:hypothetical protein
MVERDMLNNTMLKIGCGFHPPTVLADARQHLSNITKIVSHMEELSKKPKDEIVANDYWDLKEKMRLK